jgi:hypothetical protein
MIMTLFIMRFCIPTCGIYIGREERVTVYAFNHQDLEKYFMTNINKHLGKAKESTKNAWSKHKSIHCKKRLSIFLSSVGMSLSRLSLPGNN